MNFLIRLEKQNPPLDPNLMTSVRFKIFVYPGDYTPQSDRT